MRAFSPRLLGHHQLQPKGAVPTARAQPYLVEGTALGAVFSNVLAASNTSAGSMGLSAVGWADVPLPKREINQPLPGSTNGHDGKTEGKAKGEKVHLSIKQVCPHSGTEGKFSQTSVHPVVNSA